jgi:hypothetical protein
LPPVPLNNANALPNGVRYVCDGPSDLPRRWGFSLTGFQRINFSGMSKMEQTGHRRSVKPVPSPACFGIYPVTESSAMLPPNAWEAYDLIPAIPDRYRTPSLLPLPNADDVGTRFAGAYRLRAPGVRMPQMRSRGDERHCVRPVQVEGGRMACRRTRNTELRQRPCSKDKARVRNARLAVLP